MLDPHDLTQIASLIDKSIAKSNKSLKETIHGVETRLRDEMKGEINGLRSEVKDIETGLKKDIKGIETGLKDEIKTSEKRLSKKIDDVKQEIIQEVGSFVETALLPQLDDKAEKSEVERLDKRIDTISPIAHEIKRKR